MISTARIRIFGLGGSEKLAAGIAAGLGVQPGALEERDFEDGEHKARPLDPVRGRPVYVVHSLYGDGHHSANDKLCRLLFFCGACRDAGAASVSAVVPYLCYARKDRKTKARDPVTTRYVARMFEAVDIDRVVTVEVHNLAAFQNAFRVATEHLDCNRLFARRLLELAGKAEFAVVSPDAGGTKRAAAFRRILGLAGGGEATSAFMEKYRSRGEVSGERLVGDVDGRCAVIVDDLIATGGTMLRSARAAREKGAHLVYALATHGLFVEGANEVFADPAIDRLIVSNSVEPFRLTDPDARGKLEVIDLSRLIAEAVGRIESGGSLVDLLSSET